MNKTFLEGIKKFRILIITLAILTLAGASLYFLFLHKVNNNTEIATEPSYYFKSPYKDFEVIYPTTSKVEPIYEVIEVTNDTLKERWSIPLITHTSIRASREFGTGSYFSIARISTIKDDTGFKKYLIENARIFLENQKETYFEEFEKNEIKDTFFQGQPAIKAVSRHGVSGKNSERKGITTKYTTIFVSNIGTIFYLEAQFTDYERPGSALISYTDSLNKRQYDKFLASFKLINNTN